MTNPIKKKKAAPDHAKVFEILFSNLQQYLPDFPPALNAALHKHCKVVRFKRNGVILDYKKVCNYCYFACEGLVTAKYKEDDEEHFTWFMAEGDIIIAVESFYHQLPSEEKLIALEETVCVALSWDDLQMIYREHPEFNIVGRKLTEEYYRQAMRRTKWVNLTAAERYVKLIEDYARFINRVPDKALASYLGIDRATLSRIKKDYAGKKEADEKERICMADGCSCIAVSVVTVYESQLLRHCVCRAA